MSDAPATFSRAMAAYRRARERAAVLRHVSVGLRKFAADLHEPEFVLLEDGGAHRHVDLHVIADAVATIEELIVSAEQQAATILAAGVDVELPHEEDDDDEDDDEFRSSISTSLRVVPNPTLKKKRQTKSEEKI
ncbi:MAG: hypothetical protein KC731_15850 [Myxococcales bacterium]|nr:hypothetical protein [Myxococcales bacterium]